MLLLGCLYDSLGHYATMRNAVLACISVIVAFRVSLLVYHFTMFSMDWSGWLEAVRKPTVTLAQATESEQVKAEAKKVYKELASYQFDASMLGGTIAAATWSVIFVVDKPDEPASRLSGVSVGLLFIGAVVLIAGPVLARHDKPLFGTLLRDSAIYVGLNAILFSFCSMAMDLASTPWRVIALLIVLCATARELRYSWVQHKRIWGMKRNRRAAQAAMQDRQGQQTEEQGGAQAKE